MAPRVSGTPLNSLMIDHDEKVCTDANHHCMYEIFVISNTKDLQDEGQQTSVYSVNVHKIQKNY